MVHAAAVIVVSESKAACLTYRGTVSSCGQILELNSLPDLACFAGKCVQEKLSTAERERLLRVYRQGNPPVRQWAHVVLLLDDGHSPERVAQLTYLSAEMVAEAVEKYKAKAFEGLPP